MSKMKKTTASNPDVTTTAVSDTRDLCHQYERHVVLDHIVPIDAAPARTCFEAISSSLRDKLAQQWLRTQQTYDRENPKRVYYLSMEFLIGRTLLNNITNLGVESDIAKSLRQNL